MPKSVVSAVPADGLAPLGARTSAGTVMAILSPAYVWDWHFEGEIMIYTHMAWEQITCHQI